jgi:pimeloyl-ACP methyl ester carboxylesterase
MVMEKRTGSIKVHLVHGTWANGLLKPRQAWFDRGSVVYERLRNCVPRDSEIESFRWSGRNNISSRAVAAESFAQHLESSITQHPHSEHIIVAHSHGGTVAADALLRLSERTQAISKIKGLVCLATPFVYLVKPTFAQLATGFFALTALLNALLWSGLIASIPSTLINLPILTLTALVAIAATLVLIPAMILAASVSNKFESQFSRKMVIDVPIFQLRATRDEASLSLGLMQSFNWLLSAFAANSDRPQGSLRNPVNWVKHLIGLTACSLIGYWLMKRFESQLGMELTGNMRFLIGQFIYAPAVAGAAYFVGYCLLAMAVGHTKVHEWLATSIEVDAAPPDVFCQLKIYTSLSTSSDSLRHGLYEHDDVIKDVGAIVSKLSSKT